MLVECYNRSSLVGFCCERFHVLGSLSASQTTVNYVVCILHLQVIYYFIWWQCHTRIVHKVYALIGEVVLWATVAEAGVLEGIVGNITVASMVKQITNLEIGAWTLAQWAKLLSLIVMIQKENLGLARHRGTWEVATLACGMPDEAEHGRKKKKRDLYECIVRVYTVGLWKSLPLLIFKIH